MRILHSHDPVPGDDRDLTTDELKAAAASMHQSMWTYAELGEFALAHVREVAGRATRQAELRPSGSARPRYPLPVEPGRRSRPE